ncbi:MAG: Tol-Pal system beta propeller repeat protein TolB [Sphingomonadales bacterium]|nr:Tol-Pal system beta propeller repeat protein TolB [Sphingomonadales bacterium]
MKKETTVRGGLWALVILAACGLFAAPAHAVLRVDINQAHVAPLPIAVVDLPAAGEGVTHAGTLAEIGASISGVIRANLQRSGLFEPIDTEAFISTPGPNQVRPRFGDWRAISAQALVSGRIALEADGRIRIEFRLWDIFAESQMTGLRYLAPPQNWRRIAHLISDAIYRRLTGEAGYFDTRIVYIAETGPQTERVKRLAIMDQDGYNHRFLTNGNDLVLTPRFSPSRQDITYMAYYNDKPRVYLYNIESGKHEVLGDFPNMTFAPRFSPDGNRVVMSLAEDGNSDIYAMDLRTRRVRRLTAHPGIDTSPSYSPDNRNIVFNSDRGGSQQLYTMRADGSNIKRISFGSGRYGTPVWSPRGDLIAFTKIGNGKFRIGVMRPDGSGERLLTDTYHDEGPTWSPNGRVLIFFRQERFDAQGRGGRARLRSIDLTGYNEMELQTPFDASDPAWSPLLP